MTSRLPGDRSLYVNATPEVVRVALLEDGRLAQLDVEPHHRPALTGNVYRGRVNRVLPGMQAAFVDIALERTAFLAAADYQATAAGDDAERAPLETRLKAGQDIVVQVTKEPRAGKGARLTSALSFPGKGVVYLPFGAAVAISRRIEDEAERSRLQAAADRLTPPGGGLIVRTAAVGMSAEELATDLEWCVRRWREVEAAALATRVPGLLYRDLDPARRALLDHGASLDRVVVDDRVTYDRLAADLAVWPAAPALELDAGHTPLFDATAIEPQIAAALEPRVALASGGFLMIESTEAMTTIDVNTGSFVGHADQASTALATNLEAAAAIAEQLRLRNLGGVIVVDFIDMADPAARQEVRTTLDEGLRRQQTRTEISQFSGLGLVELTRRRNRRSLAEQLAERCPACAGAGLVASAETTAYAALRRMRNHVAAGDETTALVVSVHPDVAAYLAEHHAAALGAMRPRAVLESDAEVPRSGVQTRTSTAPAETAPGASIARNSY